MFEKAIKTIEEARRAFLETPRDWGFNDAMARKPSFVPDGWKAVRSWEDSDQNGSSYSAVREVWMLHPDLPRRPEPCSPQGRGWRRLVEYVHQPDGQ